MRNLKEIIKLVLGLYKHVKQAVSSNIQRVTEYRLEFTTQNNISSVTLVLNMTNDVCKLSGIPHFTTNVLKQRPMSTTV